MLELLAKVEHSLLAREVSKIPLVEAIGLESDSAPRIELAQILIAYYGIELLSIASIRHLLLTLIPLDKLNQAARRLQSLESEYVYDAALGLAVKDWSSNSLLPRLLQAMLEEQFRFKLGEEYLPGITAERPPTLEEVFSEPRQPLLDFQQEVSDKILALLDKTGSRAMIQMPTGSGKTRTVTDAIARYLSNKRLNNSILWLAHSEELCEQAISTYRRSWLYAGTGRGRIYRLWGDHLPAPHQITGGIVIAGLQKLVSLSKKKSPLYMHIAKSCTALIFDEAHKALALTYRELLADISKTNSTVTIIGLSATPGRSAWNSFENKQLAKLFHNTLISPTFGEKDTLAALREMGVLARLKRVPLESPARLALLEHEKHYVEDFFELPVSVLTRLSKNVYRNKLITSTLVEQVKAGRPTIVFACSVQHSKIIAALASIQGIKACAITSDMNSATRARYIEGFRNGQYQAIINYGILSTGFDAPNTGSVIIARPTASMVLYSQMIGRGMRGPKVGGREECRIIDIVDNIDGFGAEEDIYQHFSSYWN